MVPTTPPSTPRMQAILFNMEATIARSEPELKADEPGDHERRK
jgi:hypothetical protein